MKRVARGTFYIFIEQVVLAVSNALLIFFLARMLGPYKYGQYAVTLAFCGIFHMFFEAGFPGSITKGIASEENKIYSLMRFGYIGQLTCSTFIFLLVFIGAPFWAEHVLGDKSFTLYIRVASLYFIPYALMVISCSILNGQRLFERSILIRCIWSVLRVLVILLFFIKWKDVVSIFYAMFAAGLLAGVSTRFIMPKIRKQKTNIDMKKIIVLTFLLVISATAVQIDFRADKLFIKNIIQKDDIVGIYALASIIALLLISFSRHIVGALFPSMSRTFAIGEMKLTREYLIQGTRYLMLFFLPVSFGLNIVGKDIILVVFGNQYLRSIEPFAILIFAAVFFAFFTLHKQLLISIDRQWANIFVTLMVLILILALNPLFIRKYGFIGAAWAVLICSVIGALATSAYIFKILRTKYPLLSFLRILGATLICYFLAALVSDFAPVARYGVYIFLMLCFMGILVISKELTGKDWQNLKDIFIST